jgi:hypothetical protein
MKDSGIIQGSKSPRIGRVGNLERSKVEELKGPKVGRGCGELRKDSRDCRH